MAYEFNLIELERKTNLSYFDYIAKDSPVSRDAFFLSVRDLAYALATINNTAKKHNLEPDEVSNEYALRLFERVVLKGFRFSTNTGKIPFTSYFKLNMRDVIISDCKPDFKTEVRSDVNKLREALLADEIPEVDRFSKDYYMQKIYEGLKVFYKDKEIKKFISLAVDVIYQSKGQPIPDGLPLNLRDFCVVLIAMAKRTYEFNISDHIEGDINKALASGMRSSVLLAAVANTQNFPAELMLSLDLNSLTRLATISGGKKIRVPTLKQLDGLTGAVAAISEHLLTGSDYKEVLKRSKIDLDLVFSTKININDFIEKVLHVIEFKEEEESTEPLINMLLASRKALESYVNQMKESNSTHRYRPQLTKTIQEYRAFLNGLEEVVDEEHPW